MHEQMFFGFFDKNCLFGIDTSAEVEYYTNGRWSKQTEYPIEVVGSFGTAISDNHILVCGGIYTLPGLLRLLPPETTNKYIN
jgi:hypothetical protein